MSVALRVVPLALSHASACSGLMLTIVRSWLVIATFGSGISVIAAMESNSSILSVQAYQARDVARLARLRCHSRSCSWCAHIDQRALFVIMEGHAHVEVRRDHNPWL